MAEFSNNIKVNTNLFPKGINKDIDPRFLTPGQYIGAINAVLTSREGDFYRIGNEPSTIKCSSVPYTFIGSIQTNKGIVIFSTNNIDSEIGLLDQDCNYTTLVNDPCLKFSTFHLVRGVSKENYDCTESLYWNDGLNPARVLNIDKIPYIKESKPDPEGGCDIETDTPDLDCEALRLTPLLTVPDIELQGDDGGNLPNGAYYVTVAYSSKGIRISDYLTVSNPSFLYNITGIGGSLTVNLSNLDQDFDEYELILISTVNQQNTARRIGFYSTSQSTVYIDTLRESDIVIKLSDIPLQSVYYEGGDAVFQVNQYLIQTNVRTRKEFNYQPQALKIRAKWVAYAVPESYYRQSGNKIGYTKGETVNLFIRFVYNTGHRSPAFQLVGREATGDEKSRVNNKDSIAYGEGENVEKWEIYNTATITRTFQPTAAAEYPVMEGDFGYYESKEQYPDNREVWGSKSCNPILHFRFPDNCMVKNYDEFRKKLIILGFRLENIQYPLDENGDPVEGIVGYEVLRADKEGHKDIVAKGMIYNTGEYESPTAFNEKRVTLYPNYPYNDLRTDPFLSRREVRGGCAGQNYRSMGAFNRQYFTFHSPETSFGYIGLGNIMKVEAEYYGKVRGNFEPVYRHPKNKLIRDFALFTSAVVGIGEGVLAIAGKRTYNVDPTYFEADATFLGVGGKLQKPIPLLSSLFSSSPIVGLFTTTLGVKAVGATSKTVEETAVDKIPTVLKVANAAVLFTYYFAQGANATLNVIKAIVPFQQYAYQYNSEGLYSKQICPRTENIIRGIDNYTYLYPNYQEFEGYRVNNNLRESSVLLKLNDTLEDPVNIDNTRQTIGTMKFWDGPTQSFETQTSAYYVSIRKKMKSQYGQIGSVSILPTGSKIFPISPDEPASTDIIFGGDTIVEEFTLKRKMHYYYQTAVSGTNPNGFEFDYRLYPNIQYPRYWMDTHEYDLSEFFNITDINLPNDFHHLDRRRSDCNRKLSFVVKRGYFYLYNSGITRFFVESSYNLPFRKNSTTNDLKKHYDREFNTDLPTLLRSDVIYDDNHFEIDKSLSPIKRLPLVYAETQQRDFSIENARCFVQEPNKIIYSLPSNLESKRDTWRNFLANNYFIFPKSDGRVVTIKDINKTGAIYFFENAPAKYHPGVDELQTTGGLKITVGDGGLFARQPQAIANTDYDYTECQSAFSVVNTHFGVFFISQRQGKIFQYAGQLNDISMGIKYWLSEYLPSKLLKQFPDFELSDNPVSGIGCQAVFDNTCEMVYFTKKDYELKEELLDRVTYKGDDEFLLDNRSRFLIGDPRYFNDASWTISYDPKIKAWVSFHDWHPDALIQTSTHFMSFKGQNIWKHNEAIDSFCNFYEVDYPWEVEFSYSDPQIVTALESIEYQLECYKYFGRDRFHILEENFDRAIIYNSEQCSGLLKLIPREINRPFLILNYPKIGTSSTEIEVTKQEQKYRFNQFADITKNRGQFTLNWRTIWRTEANGYKKLLNQNNLDFNKSSTERKRFRHNNTSLILRKNISGNVKMMLLLNNSKSQISFR